MPDSPVTSPVAMHGARVPRRRMRPALVVFAILSFIGLTRTWSHDRPTRAAEPPRSLRGDDAIAYLRQEGIYDSLAAAVTEARYAITRIAHDQSSERRAEYEALNPARDLRAAFTDAGVRVHSTGDAKWQLGLELLAYGYGDARARLTAGETTVRGDRIEIGKHVVDEPEAPALIEWYVNTPAGLEQGFTLPAPPTDHAGRRAAASAGASSFPWLHLSLALSGDVRAEVSEDRQAVRLNDGQGRQVANYDHLEAWDATGRKLPARMVLREHELSLEVDDRDARYPIVVDPLVWQESARVTGDPNAYDSAGYSVGISGNTVIIGCRHDQFSHQAGFDTLGRVFVFVRESTALGEPSKWNLQATLVPPDGKRTQDYGTSVAISGDTAIVGDPTGSFDEEFHPISSAAYVWGRSGGAWQLRKRLQASDNHQGNQFGYSVAISSGTAVVGAPFWGPFVNNAARGKAYVFGDNGGAWTEQAQLEPDDGKPGDQFGLSVAVSGNTAIVGAPYHETVTEDGTGQGQAYVFARADGDWSPPTRLKGDSGYSFAYSVGVSGKIAVVGAYAPEDSGNDGAAYIFRLTGSAWNKLQVLTADDTVAIPSFGYSVGITGDTVVVGAPSANIESGGATNARQGAAYVFSGDGFGSALKQRTKLTASDGETVDVFGFSVAVSGGTVLGGAPGHDVEGKKNQGAAYVFEALDTDGDGLPDDWEENGVTVDGVVIDLKRMGADPRHKDIFVHADWMQEDPSRPGVLFYPYPRAIKQVIDAFAAAPVENPDKKKGINIHIDLGENSIMNPVTGEKWGSELSKAGDIPFSENIGSLEFGETITEETFGWDAIDEVKKTYFNPAKRGGIFHYVLFANALNGLPNSGLSRDKPAADFLVTLGQSRTPGGTELTQAGTFMHELGHNLGLRHGGSDEINEKPNYISIMNYRFQMTGLLSPNGKQQKMDYSRNALPPLDESSLKEGDGIADPAKHLTTWNSRTNPNLAANACITHPKTYNKGFLPAPSLDWNCDGGISSTPVAEDINGDGVCVEHGGDYILTTIPAGDDEVLENEAISAGPDRQCDTAAAVGDKQIRKVGYIQTDVLESFNDWPALVFGGGGSIGALGAEEAQMHTPSDEASIEDLENLVQPGLLDEELVAPHDVVTASPVKGAPSLLVSFDGSASTAVNGTVVDWAWDFGDGTTGTGAVVMHTYDTPGDYFASLTVTDSNGHVNLAPLLTLITVGEPVPTATPTPAMTATAVVTPTGGATTTPGGPPIPTATPATPSGPTSTPLSTPPVTTPSPQPTSTSALGIGDVDPDFGPTVTSVDRRNVDVVLTQPDGKIIVGGQFESYAGCARRNIARINPDGSCDSTFDPGLALTVVFQNASGTQVVPGTHRIDLPVLALARQADGKILAALAAGFTGFQNGVRTSPQMLVRLNTDGTLDSSFHAPPSFVVTPTQGPGFSGVLAIAVQPNGKIIVVGGFTYSDNRTPVLRLNSDGSIDPSFAGPSTPYFGLNVSYDSPRAVALQADGKILIGGLFFQLPRHGIVRLNADGSLDAGYNAPIPGTSSFSSGLAFATTVHEIAIQTDGKAIVAGGLLGGTPSGVARLEVDGSRDTSFADWRPAGTSAGIYALALQTDGRIVIGSDFRISTPAVRNSIARLDSNGALDPTFDTPGMKGLYGEHNSEVRAVALTTDGKIVAVGPFDNFDDAPAEGIVQLATNGSRDPSFDSNGAGTSSQVYTLLRQPDGKLLVGFQPGSIARPARLNAARRGGIGRLNQDGGTDTTFTSPFDYGSTVFGMALQTDGKVLVGGSFRLIGSQQTLELARLNADGTLDAGFMLAGPDRHLGNNTGFAVQADGKILANEVSGFGTRRLVRLNTDGSPDDTFAVPLSGGAVEHIVVQPDGKLLVTGLVPASGGAYARVARLLADGSLDATFAPVEGPNDLVRAILLQPDGKILIAGYFYDYATPQQRLARLNADGSLDAAFTPAMPYTNLQQLAVSALALQPDGKVVVGMDFSGNSALDLQNRVFRLNPDGSLDASFPQDETGFESINSIPNGTRIRALVSDPDDGLIVGGDFDCVDGTARLALARLLGATPAPRLDHFLLYNVKTTKGSPKFAPLGPLTLADTVATADVDVQKRVALGVPADVNGGGVGDAVTHLTDYVLKPRKGGTKFRPIPDVRVQNPCGELVVTVKKPGDLLVPTLVNPSEPALPPSAADHEVADFRCYVVKIQKKRSDGTPVAGLPKGTQVDATDTIQSRRYDLKKLTRLCYPVAESGAPLLLKTGEPVEFTPAPLRHETVHLACYQATPAKKRIEQNGCGPIDPKDKGVKIVPAPGKHQAQSGLRVLSQLGRGTLDTAKEVELCIPSTIGAP